MTQQKTPPSALVLPGVQVLRGIAAILVVWHHAVEHSLDVNYAYMPSDWVILLGAVGVDIFFVISGFIMVYVSFIRPQKTTKPLTFLIKRIMRIYPFYWLCVIGILILQSLGFFASLDTSSGVVIRSFALLPSENMVLGVAWTLVYEMYFYLVFTLCLFLRNKYYVVAASSALIIAIHLLSPSFSSGELAVFLNKLIVIEFCFGMALGLAFITYKDHWHKMKQSILYALGTVGIVAASVAFAHLDTSGISSQWRFIVWGVPAMLVVAGSLLVRGTLTPSALLSTGIFIGNASYAIYLTHVVVMNVYGKLLKVSPLVQETSQHIVVPIVILVSIGVGCIAHLLAEKPLLSLGKIITNSFFRKPLPSVSSPAKS